MQVKEIIRPERYLGADHLFDLDIALLVLNNSVQTGDYIMPACMDWGATSEPKHNEVGYVSNTVLSPSTFCVSHCSRNLMFGVTYLKLTETHLKMKRLIGYYLVK